MLNYIKSELYRTKHRRYSYGFIITCSLIVLLGCIGYWYLGNSFKQDFSMGHVIYMATQMLPAIYFLTLIIVDNIFSEEYKHHTLKNTISMGVDRRNIYMGKFIVEIIYAVISFIIIIGVLFLSSYFLLGFETGALGMNTAEIIKWFAVKTIAIFPILITGIALANFLAFLINNNTYFAFAFVGMMFLPSKIVSIFAMFNPNLGELINILPSHIFDMMPTEGYVAGDIIMRSYIMGIVYVVIFSVVGIILFKRKEVR